MLVTESTDGHQANCSLGQWVPSYSDHIFKCGPFPPDSCTYSRVPSPRFLVDLGAKYQGNDVIDGQEVTVWMGSGNLHLGWMSYNPTWTISVTVTKPHRMLKMVAVDNFEPGEHNFSQKFIYPPAAAHPFDAQTFSPISCYQ